MSGGRDLYTPAEYLQLERAAEWKNEYRNGKILPMASGSRAHNLINGNLVVKLGQQLRETTV